MENNKLTETYYRSTENTAVSVSKAKAYRKSKAYYKGRYKDGTIVDEPSPSMLLGLMVDAAWTAGDIAAIAAQYTTEKDGSGVKVRPSDFEKAHAIATQLLTLPPLDGDKVLRQVPLYATVKKRRGGKTQEVEICGIPDAVVITGDRAVIYDLKTARASAVDSDKSWFWQCYRMGYFEQLAVYGALVSRHFKIKPHKISYRHIVIGTTEDCGKFPVRLYKIPRLLLAGHFNKFLSTAFDIKNETAWIDPDPEWRVLHNPDGFDVETEDEE